MARSFSGARYENVVILDMADFDYNYLFKENTYENMEPSPLCWIFSRFNHRGLFVYFIAYVIAMSDPLEHYNLMRKPNMSRGTASHNIIIILLLLYRVVPQSSIPSTMEYSTCIPVNSSSYVRERLRVRNFSLKRTY